MTSRKTEHSVWRHLRGLALVALFAGWFWARTIFPLPKTRIDGP